MAESIDYNQAFQLADRFEEYRLIKSWGIMLIVTGISLAVYRLYWVFWFELPVIFQRDFNQFFYPYMTLLSIFGVSFAILPFILAITTYIAVKRTTVEDHEISSKRYLLYGITLVALYFNNVFMPIIFGLYIRILLFPQSIVILKNNTFRQVINSGIQRDVSNLFFGGFSFLISYLLLTRVVKRTKFKELLVPGAVLILFSLISIFFGSSIPPPSYETFSQSRALEDCMLWVNTIIIVASFIGSGLYSIRKAYRILEGRE